jgi:hypothetical protein
LLPNAVEPKAGAAGALGVEDHGDDLSPRAEAPPKAGVAVAGAPNGDGALAAGEPNVAALGVLAVGAGPDETGTSPVAMPG